MRRSCNPAGLSYEVVILDPPLAGQYESTVEQSGVWRQKDEYLIERQERFGEAIAGLLGHGSFRGRTIARAAELATLRSEQERGRRFFFLPHTTLCDPATVESLRIGRHNFYGGSVRRRHEGTKVIMRPLLRTDSPRPAGWNAGFARAVAPLGIPGYAVFDLDDLTAATRAVLAAHGRARIKLATGAGGVGQFVVETATELASIVATIEKLAPLELGACVEADLTDPRVYCVSTETIGTLDLCLVNHSHRDTSVRGAEVSTWTVDEIAVGGLDRLDIAPLEADGHDRLADVVDLARRLDACVDRHLGGALITRRFHQFMLGRDAHGIEHLGTVEQSWRRGANSACSLLAARAFLAAGDLIQVRCEKQSVKQGPLAPDTWLVYTRDHSHLAVRIGHRVYAETRH